jgi:hypothetical protein
MKVAQTFLSVRSSGVISRKHAPTRVSVLRDRFYCFVSVGADMTNNLTTGIITEPTAPLPISRSTNRISAMPSAIGTVSEKVNPARRSSFRSSCEGFRLIVFELTSTCWPTLLNCAQCSVMLSIDRSLFCWNRN